MPILGINAYHGDASAAIFVDARLVAAAEEALHAHQALRRVPGPAVRYCLEATGAKIGVVDHVAIPAGAAPPEGLVRPANAPTRR
jgi:carbamoyltransferase